MQYFLVLYSNICQCCSRLFVSPKYQTHKDIIGPPPVKTTGHSQTSRINIRTIFDMVLYALPNLEAQSANMLSHIQQRVVRQLWVIMRPLGSRATMATPEVNRMHLYIGKPQKEILSQMTKTCYYTVWESCCGNCAMMLLTFFLNP